MKRIASQLGLITILSGLILLLLVGCRDFKTVQYFVKCADLKINQNDIREATINGSATYIYYKDGTDLKINNVACVVQSK